MPVHIWSVLCARSIIDSETNNISIIDVIEQVSVPALPPAPAGGTVFLPLSLELVSLWSRENGEIPENSRCRVQIFSPGGMPAGMPSTIDFQIDLTVHQRSRTRARMPGLPIRESGTCRFVVEMSRNGTYSQVASIPIQIIIGAAGSQVPSRLN